MTLREEVHYGRRMLCFAQRPAGFHAFLEKALARDPQREALISGDLRLTYAQFDELVARVAAGFAARGLGRGDRVALLIGNRPEFVIAAFAAARLGAIWTPLNTRDQAPGLAHALNDSGSRLLIAEAGLIERLPPPAETPDLRGRVAIGGDAEGFEPWEALRSAGRIDEAVAAEDEAPVAIFYTSGTTGRAKGAVLTNLGLVHSAMHYAQAMGLGPQDKSCCTVPLGHVTGSIAILATLLHAGGSVVLTPGFKAAEFLKLAEAERITHMVMVPAQYALCLLQEDLAERDLSAWRIGGFGGAPMAEATIKGLAAKLPKLRLMNLYGATETSSPAAVLSPEDLARHPDSVGRAVACARLRVADSEGRDLPPGEPGEILVAGPMVVPGYWGNPEATAAAFDAEGYWRTGDLGSLDSQGFLRVFDRIKDMINRGGLKIYSVEVENLLLEDEDVAEAAVVGKPCPVLGERVHAFVVARPGRSPDPEKLRARCRRALSDYKIPESFVVFPNPLPRNANGKLLKRDLRAFLLAQGEA